MKSVSVGTVVWSMRMGTYETDTCAKNPENPEILSPLTSQKLVLEHRDRINFYSCAIGKLSSSNKRSRRATF